MRLVGSFVYKGENESNRTISRVGVADAQLCECSRNKFGRGNNQLPVHGRRRWVVAIQVRTRAIGVGPRIATFSPTNHTTQLTQTATSCSYYLPEIEPCLASECNHHRSPTTTEQ